MAKPWFRIQIQKLIQKIDSFQTNVSVFAWQRQLLMTNILKNLTHLSACKSNPPKKHFVKNWSKGPHIERKSMLLWSYYFWTQVVGSSDECVGCFSGGFELIIFVIFASIPSYFLFIIRQFPIILNINFFASLQYKTLYIKFLFIIKLWLSSHSLMIKHLGITKVDKVNVAVRVKH